jgi:hypothetical protein
MPVCSSRTSGCIGEPARVYRVWPNREVAILCDPCAGWWRAMGTGLEDDRPEWVRRASEGRLPAKVLGPMGDARTADRGARPWSGIARRLARGTG